MQTQSTVNDNYAQEPAVSLGWDTYTTRRVGPKYAVHDSNAPIYGRDDIPGLIIAIIMALGPLSAYAFGWGL